MKLDHILYFRSLLVYIFKIINFMQVRLVDDVSFVQPGENDSKDVDMNFKYNWKV